MAVLISMYDSTVCLPSKRDWRVHQLFISMTMHSDFKQHNQKTPDIFLETQCPLIGAGFPHISYLILVLNSGFVMKLTFSEGSTAGTSSDSRFVFCV